VIESTLRKASRRPSSKARIRLRPPPDRLGPDRGDAQPLQLEARRHVEEGVLDAQLRHGPGLGRRGPRVPDDLAEVEVEAEPAPSDPEEDHVPGILEGAVAPELLADELLADLADHRRDLTADLR